MPTDTPTPELGSKVPDFELPTPYGDSHTSKSLMRKEGLVLAFICNHCPYVVAVIDRMAEDMRTLEGMGFGTAFIMSNDWTAYPADAPDRMKTFIAAHKITSPYLIDESQDLARACGADCTPDIFGYDSDGLLRYRGRLDDKGRENPEGRTPELIDAMRQVAETGKGPEVQHPSIGCSIKWR